MARITSDGILTSNVRIARLTKVLFSSILCDYAGTTTTTAMVLVSELHILEVLGFSEQDGGEGVHWMVDPEVGLGG